MKGFNMTVSPLSFITNSSRQPMDRGLQRPATILVADDMAHNREMLAVMLRGAGYRVILAADGNEVLELLATGPIDMALLDVMMPGCTGMSVCRQIRNKIETRLLPVLLITGLNSIEDRIQGIECGADDFLIKPIMKDELLARVKSLLRIKQITDELENVDLVFFSLALGAEAKNPYTKGRCDRLAKYSVALGQRIGLPDDQLVALGRGAVVHDLGTLGIPDDIMQKAGPLSYDEWALMKTHPEIGERICMPLRSFSLVLPIIRHHHERLDGSGYPDGLKNSAIPLTAQVLTMVDIYDALTSDRSYREALSHDKAFGIIAEEVKRGWRDRDLALELQTVILETHVSSLSSKGDTALSPQWG
jgi:putative two-component system response regulator